MDCFFPSKEKLEEPKVQESFKEIDVKITKFRNLYEIYWSYNISNCYSSSYKGYKYYKCAFQLVLASENTNDTYAAITLD